jgi:hypothetical protein
MILEDFAIFLRCINKIMILEDFAICSEFYPNRGSQDASEFRAQNPGNPKNAQQS